MVSTATTLTLLPHPSLSFSHSSSSSFLAGGTRLRSHKNFAALTLSADSCPFGGSKLNSSNARSSTYRFGRSVVCASGDYYATLGVPKSASGKEIKAAYRKLARQVRNWNIYIFLFWRVLFGHWEMEVMERWEKKIWSGYLKESNKRKEG